MKARIKKERMRVKERGKKEEKKEKWRKGKTYLPQNFALSSRSPSTMSST